MFKHLKENRCVLSSEPTLFYQMFIILSKFYEVLMTFSASDNSSFCWANLNKNRKTPSFEDGKESSFINVATFFGIPKDGLCRK